LDKIPVNIQEHLSKTNLSVLALHISKPRKKQ
jgi:hypothetical protein